MQFIKKSVILFCIMFSSMVLAEPHNPHSYSTAVQLAAPAVVNVNTARIREQSPQQRRRPGTRTRTHLGSGVIINKQGYILTNYHVVQNARAIYVALSDGRKTKAVLIGRDPETDLAVIRIRLKGLHAAILGDSDKLRVGDVVLAIGNPFGLGQTVTQGIISAIGRNTIGINQLENYIQTDAAINPGNSGGALVNAEGKVIGINTGIYSHSGGYQGVGFAIPINVARNVMQQIIKIGYVKRGWLGVKMRSLRDAAGVMIVSVIPKSPAAKAGIQPGDTIKYLNSHRVQSARGFLNYIAQREPGTTVVVKLLRRNREKTLAITIGTRPATPLVDDRGHAPPSPPVLRPSPRPREDRWY